MSAVPFARLRYLLLLLVLPFAPSLQAESVEGHPLIQPYAGSTLRAGETLAFDAYRRVIGVADGASVTETLEGRVTRLSYGQPRGRSTLEVLANYREALLGAGLAVDFECEGPEACANRGVGRLGVPGWNELNGINLGIAGDVRYLTASGRIGAREVAVAIAVNPSVHYVHVIEGEAMQTGQVVLDADALAEALARDGRVVVDGILFDTGSDRLRAESDPALQHVATLLGAQPALGLWVVGHTDATGTLDANLDLSRRRAAAVVRALVERFGVDPGRLDPHGVGPLSPVASNRQDGGRQANRRVELVERD